MILYLDTETFSDIPLSEGVHRYSETVEVMIVTYAFDDGPVQTWDRTADPDMPNDLLTALCFDEWQGQPIETIVMHQSQFDRTVWRRSLKVDIPPERIHDTMVQAMAHGLPGGLDKLCSIFKVPVDLAKDKRGKQLIQLFCKPRPKNMKLRRATRDTHPVEWQQFLDYAGSDISAMRYLYRNMPRWNYPTTEHGLWVLDQKVNDRGFQVDLDLARAAIATVERVKEATDAQTQELTEDRLRSTTQRDKLLEELLLEHGVRLPDLQAYTIERRLEDPDLPEAVRELLAARLMTSTTSTSKYNRILKCVSSDGRLRGSIQFCGAPRTKRKSGRLFQPQNLPRPDMPADEIEHGIAAMKAGCAHLMFDDPNRLAWNALRGLIVAGEGRKLVQGDLSGIEARVLPWLAREQWKLDAFRAYDTITGYDMLGDPIRGGPDLYLIGAGRILHKPFAEVTKYERQSHGKVPELACGYGGAVGAFHSMAKIYDIRLSDAEAHEIVRAWRDAHPAIASWEDGFWVTLDHAARMAIRHSGQTFEAGPYIRFEKWRAWLRMELPSGGFLSYADPQIVADPRRPGSDSISFMGINNYTRKWERLYTYGGKLSADATQATARDILYHNAPLVEESGYPIVMEIHDEFITEPLDTPNHSVQELVRLISRRPPWIDDNLPLAANGFEAYRYKKDD